MKNKLREIQEYNEELRPKFCGARASSIHNMRISPLYFITQLKDDSDTKATDLGGKLHAYLLENNQFSDLYLQESFEAPKSTNQKEFCRMCAKNLDLLTISLIEYTNKDVAYIPYTSNYNMKGKSEDKMTEEAVDLYLRYEPYISYLRSKDKYRGTISTSDMSYIVRASNKAKDHILANYLLFGSETDETTFAENELELFWEHPTLKINGSPMVLKGSIDRLVIDFKKKKIMLIDVKTSKYLPEFEQKFEEYGYQVQMASYWNSIKYMFERVFKEYDITEFELETNIVGFQTPNYVYNYPIECKVVRIENTLIKKGNEQLQKYLSDLVFHFEKDEWNHSKFYYDNNGLDLIIHGN